MPRNGSGQYVPPTNSFNPAINGTLATAGDWQALLNDMVAALTQSLSADGQTPLTGPLNAGNNPINNVTAGTGTGQALAFQQLFNQGVMSDLASTATTDIGVQNTNFLRITGNTTITSFGSNFKGPRFLVFEGAVTLTNSSTLVLPGGANITTSAGDVLIAIPGATLGTADKWIVAAYQAATGYLKSNNPSYTGTLTGGSGVVNLGSGQFYKDAGGNVGIGTSSPGFKLQVSGSSLGRAFSLTDTNSNSSVSGQVTNGTNSLIFGVNDSAGNGLNGGGVFGAVVESSGAYPLAFVTNATERTRIDSSGNLLVGKTGSSESGVGLVLSATGFMRFTTAGTASQTMAQFNNNSGSAVGSIVTSGSSTSYNTSSDYRLKEDIAPMAGALAKVALLKPCTYKWNVDGSDGEGFIAHELAEVVPQCVTGEKDAVDAEGNPQYQGIDTSFLIATLTAAIQEQQQLITALTARVAALEAA